MVHIDEALWPVQCDPGSGLICLVLWCTLMTCYLQCPPLRNQWRDHTCMWSFASFTLVEWCTHSYVHQSRRYGYNAPMQYFASVKLPGKHAKKANIAVSLFSQVITYIIWPEFVSKTAKWVSEPISYDRNINLAKANHVVTAFMHYTHLCLYESIFLGKQ